MPAFRTLLRTGFLSLIMLPCGWAASQPFTAIYADNQLSLSIPYHSNRAGSGKFTLEILDPEDQVLGRVERDEIAVEGDGLWKEKISPKEPLPLDDMVWERIRCRFQYDGESSPWFDQIRSVSEILRRPLVHVIGQSSYLAGAQAAVRIIVSDTTKQEIGGNIRVELLVSDQPARILFASRLNHRGTVNAHFQFPAGLTGNYELRYVAETPLGSAEYTQPVHLEEHVSVLLTTEKRIYQPGQTIHVRTLVLDRSSHQAAASGPITFEILDPRGNKVFRQHSQTDEFGIASTEFTLADEVNLGTYQLHALMGDPAAPSQTAELALTIDRYVLPKFKVAVDFSANNGKPRRDYRPGDHVTGTVHANYFFGKPLNECDIVVKASSMDVALAEGAKAHGRTSEDGSYQFDLQLPSFLAGRPMDNGAAPVLVEAIVKDPSGHSETRAEPVTVSESALLITAVPEGGSLIPGFENQVFLLASYADGTPAVAELRVRVKGAPAQKVETDKRGIAMIRMTPSALSESIKVVADDRHGNRASSTLHLESRDGADQILLRSDRAVYNAGDRMMLSVFSTGQRGSIYVDVVKDGQTVLTRDLDVVDGRAELAIAATPGMSGTLDINAYYFGRSAEVIGDHRLVFVQPADELHIEATADREAYKPGEEARVHFRVTGKTGEGAHAALGLEVIDEAVFALAEQHPGFAKAFFYLEQEAMKPRFEIHSLSMTDAVEAHNESAARVLFSAMEMDNPNRLDLTFGNELPQFKASEYVRRYRRTFQQQVDQLAGRLEHWTRKSKARDAWGTELRVERMPWSTSAHAYYRVTSAGFDRQFGTADDFTASSYGPARMFVDGPIPATVSTRIQHNVGPFNGLAEIDGIVTDASGAVIPRATIQATREGNGRKNEALTDGRGGFTLAGLPAGSYQIAVWAPGFQQAAMTIALHPRDRATVALTLQVGAVTQTVTVDGAAPLLMTETAELSSATASVRVNTQQTHVRSYFPEALYINPKIITDKNGFASVTIPIADSITTWRMAMVASTTGGALGSGTSAIKVFQDFFVDLDLPVTLTQGDSVDIPVAIHNYAGESGNVALTLEPADWFALVDDSPEKRLTVGSAVAAGSSFHLEAKRIGKFKLTLSAKMTGAATREDIVVRDIEVVPNGREQTLVFNGRLDHSVEHTVRFPAGSIADASKILVRLYPGPLSQVIEGMDSILRMPGGCFEQTSSSTYPNVLALNYMKTTKKLTPEVHAKAEGYIANGYQRLLTFEVPGGGFSWFGQSSANKILTAYGLMEFHDMSKVHDVDPALIDRTRDWLISEQQRDGSWKPDTSFINEGATNRYNSDVVRITAYIAWALGNTGYRGPATERAMQFIARHLDVKLDAYTLAVLANFAVERDKNDTFARQIIEMLLAARVEKDEQVFWNAEETGVHSTGSSAAIETTGVAVQALLKWRQSPEVARKALAYIASKKDASGTWGTTQATIMALEALLKASEEGSADVRGTVEVALNGRVVETLNLNEDTSDLFHQFVLPNVSAENANNVQLRFYGTGGMAYQVAGSYFVPWDAKQAEEPLSIDISYDRTKLVQNEIVTAKATIRNNLTTVANMVMVDLGIPPGFDLVTEDLQGFQQITDGLETGSLQKFTLTAMQAMLYFNALAPKSTVHLRFRLRAKYPIRARAFQSRVYEYYDPAVSSVARPQLLEVRER